MKDDFIDSGIMGLTLFGFWDISEEQQKLFRQEKEKEYLKKIESLGLKPNDSQKEEFVNKEIKKSWFAECDGIRLVANFDKL